MNKYFKIILSAFVVVFLGLSTLQAQDRQVTEAIKMIRSGNISGAKTVLASFDDSREYPATLFLSGVLCDTPSVALKKFKKITDDYASSVWADDAEWQIFQIYILSGQLDKAEKVCNSLEKDFSGSNYINSAKDLLFTARQYKKNLQSDVAEMVSPAKSVSSVTKGEDAVTLNIKAATKAETQAAAPAKAAQQQIPTAKTTSKNIADTKQAKTKSEPAKTSSAKVVKQSANGKNWAIQVGSYTSLDVAREESERITKRYRMRNTILEKEVNGTIIYALVVGNYSSKEAAESSQKMVGKTCNCDTMVIRK